MDACCAVAWFPMDVMACPNGGSWLDIIICPGAASMGVGTVPLLMVLRRLERNWEDSSMGKRPCSASMKTSVQIPSPHVKSQRLTHTALALGLWEAETEEACCLLA